MCLNKNAAGGNLYLFISHSHNDIGKVRVIRNELEESGFEPICFYLASLTDDDEVLDLIKREIYARKFFVYVDSPNARKSKWVRSELSYLESIGREIDRTIRLNVDSTPEGKESLKRKAHRLMSSFLVFFSYAHDDKDAVSMISNALRKRGYSTFVDVQDLQPDDLLSDVISKRLEEAARGGCVLSFISDAYIKKFLSNTSSILRMEIETAVSSGSVIQPVIVGKVRTSDLLSLHQTLDLSSSTTYITVSRKPSKNEIGAVIKAIEDILKKYCEQG